LDGIEMSLINQMLKDLEQRNASAERLNPLTGEVRSVQVESRGTSSVQLALIAAVLVLGAAGAWWKFAPRSSTGPVTTMIPPVAKTPVPAPVPAPSRQPGAEPPAPVTVEPLPSSDPIAASRLPGLEKQLLTAPADRPSEKKASVATEPSASIAAAPVEMPQPAVAEKKSRETRVVRPLQATAGTSLKSVSVSQQSENLYKQAVSMLQQGRVAEARGALEQSLQENPSNHNARQLLVGLLVESKRAGEALSLLLDGVRIAPEQTGFVMALARLQVEAGDQKTALHTLEQGAKYASDDADFNGFYAALLQRDERHEEAVAHYLAALHQDPANASWLVGAGISLQAQGKYSDAREAFERARQTGQLSQDLSDFVEQRLKQLKGN
jgi:MSHA biogenesis protein MshN